MNVRDYMAVVNLINRYPELLDQGSVDELAEMFKYADFYKPNELFSKNVEGLKNHWREWVKFYKPDGLPKTRHLSTNIAVEFLSDTKATAKSYLTVFQAAEDFPLQAVISVTDHDTFEKIDGVWHFVERREYVGLLGDLSVHLTKAAPIS